jgi:hypothetical protein
MYTDSVGVRFNGDVLRAMTTLLDVVEELVEHVSRVRDFFLRKYV